MGGWEGTDLSFFSSFFEVGLELLGLPLLLPNVAGCFFLLLERWVGEWVGGWVHRRFE